MIASDEIGNLTEDITLVALILFAPRILRKEKVSLDVLCTRAAEEATLSPRVILMDKLWVKVKASTQGFGPMNAEHFGHVNLSCGSFTVGWNSQWPGFFTSPSSFLRLREPHERWKVIKRSLC